MPPTPAACTVTPPSSTKTPPPAVTLNAVLYLASTPYSLRTDIRPVRWAVAHVSLDDPAGVAELLGRLALLGRLRRAAAREQVFAAAAP